MFIREITEKEEIAERSADRRKRLLQSPSLLASLSSVFARKQQAALSLEELEREEVRLLEGQRRLNQLAKERSDLETRLRQIDKLRGHIEQRYNHLEKSHPGSSFRFWRHRLG